MAITNPNTNETEVPFIRLVDIAEHQYIPEKEFQLMLQQLLLDRATKKNIT